MLSLMTKELKAHPYNFDVKVLGIGDCCYKIIVTAPSEGDADHSFKVFLDGQFKVDWDEGFTYGNNSWGKSLIEMTYCSDDSSPTQPLNIELKIICDEVDSRDDIIDPTDPPLTIPHGMTKIHT